MLPTRKKKKKVPDVSLFSMAVGHSICYLCKYIDPPLFRCCCRAPLTHSGMSMYMRVRIEKG